MMTIRPEEGLVVPLKNMTAPDGDDLWDHVRQGMGYTTMPIFSTRSPDVKNGPWRLHFSPEKCFTAMCLHISSAEKRLRRHGSWHILRTENREKRHSKRYTNLRFLLVTQTNGFFCADDM